MIPGSTPGNQSKKMTPELITVSKIEDLKARLESALTQTKLVLGKVILGEISPDKSSEILNDAIDEIFLLKATAPEIVTFLSRKVSARTMQQVYDGILKVTGNAP